MTQRENKSVALLGKLFEHISSGAITPNDLEEAQDLLCGTDANFRNAIEELKELSKAVQRDLAQTSS